MRYLALYAVFAVLSLAGLVQQWRQAVPPTYDASNAPVVTPTVRDDGMVLVPAGPFVMGSEMASDQLPVRRIWLPASKVLRATMPATKCAASCST